MTGRCHCVITFEDGSVLEMPAAVVDLNTRCDSIEDEPRDGYRRFFAGSCQTEVTLRSHGAPTFTGPSPLAKALPAIRQIDDTMAASGRTFATATEAFDSFGKLAGDLAEDLEPECTCSAINLAGFGHESGCPYREWRGA